MAPTPAGPARASRGRGPAACRRGITAECSPRSHAGSGASRRPGRRERDHAKCPACGASIPHRPGVCPRRPPAVSLENSGVWPAGAKTA